MPRVLSIANKLLSLRGRVIVTNEFDLPIYEANGEFALISPTWRLAKGATQVATIRRKIFAWSPTWIIDGQLGGFIIKRKFFAWTRQYYVKGGGYDGAILKGNIWDLSFEAQAKNKTIAKAKGKILTLRDRHNIELLEQSDQNELFLVISMIVLQLDRKSESQDWNSNRS